MSQNAKPGLKVLVAMTRIVVIGLVVALFGFKSVLNIHGAAPTPEDPMIGRDLAIFFFSMLSPTFWINLIAPICYLSALWAASNVFMRLSRGSAFTPALVKGLREIGIYLISGSAFVILVQPSFLYFFSNGFGEAHDSRFRFSIDNITLLLIGIVLIILANQGKKLQSDLESFV